MDYVRQALEWKHGTAPGLTLGLHRHWGYHSPDAFYEAALLRLVRPDTWWLDVGCGRSPCPFNPRLAEHLARRCAQLTGIDASANLAANPYLARAVQGDIADLDGVGAFDLVTMRMVAEHVARPEAVADALRRLVAPGGVLLIYTVHAASPTALAGALASHGLHRAAMHALFRGEDRDVFPAYYRINTPGRLRRLLTGFEAERMQLIDDCRITLRWPRLHAAELAGRAALRRLGLPYPERCILAEFRRTGTAPAGKA